MNSESTSPTFRQIANTRVNDVSALLNQLSGIEPSGIVRKGRRLMYVPEHFLNQIRDELREATFAYAKLADNQERAKALEFHNKEIAMQLYALIGSVDTCVEVAKNIRAKHPSA